MDNADQRCIDAGEPIGLELFRGSVVVVVAVDTQLDGVALISSLALQICLFPGLFVF